MTDVFNPATVSVPITCPIAIDSIEGVEAVDTAGS